MKIMHWEINFSVFKNYNTIQLLLKDFITESNEFASLFNNNFKSIEFLLLQKAKKATLTEGTENEMLIKVNIHLK